jgi:D-lactate dehydrogenase
MGDTTYAKTHNSLQRLISHLGYEIIYPDKLANLCCGQIFSSKGDTLSATLKVEELAATLTKFDYPVIIDNSSCYYSLFKKTGVMVLNSVTFVHMHLSELSLVQKYDKLALHIDCSSKNEEAMIHQILAACAKQVISPINISCCGFAGDKGLNIPELNQSALLSLKEQISQCEVGVTFNRNCAIGLSHYGQKTYLSLPEVILHCLNDTSV